MTAITNSSGLTARATFSKPKNGETMKQQVIVKKNCVTAQYGSISASPKPQEFDADFAAFLVDIGNAEYVGDPAKTKAGQAKGAKKVAEQEAASAANKPAKKASTAKKKASKKAK